MEYASQNVTILYYKVSYTIFEILAILERAFLLLHRHVKFPYFKKEILSLAYNIRKTIDKPRLL